MTASLTGRKRCTCGQYKTPLANGTMPRHTRPAYWDKMDRYRVHCEGSGCFPPADKRWAKNKGDKPRGQAKRNRRITKRERKGGKR